MVTTNQAAAAHSEDQHSAFGIEQGAVWPGINPAWAPFIKAMQVAGSELGESGDYNGWLVYTVTLDSDSQGPHMVSWSSHLEGRGPCYVKVMPLSNAATLGSSYHGPLMGGAPDPALLALLEQALWPE